MLYESYNFNAIIILNTTSRYRGMSPLQNTEFYDLISSSSLSVNKEYAQRIETQYVTSM